MSEAEQQQLESDLYHAECNLEIATDRIVDLESKGHTLLLTLGSKIADGDITIRFAEDFVNLWRRKMQLPRKNKTPEKLPFNSKWIEPRYVGNPLDPAGTLKETAIRKDEAKSVVNIETDMQKLNNDIKN